MAAWLRATSAITTAAAARPARRGAHGHEAVAPAPPRPVERAAARVDERGDLRGLAELAGRLAPTPGNRGRQLAAIEQAARAAAACDPLVGGGLDLPPALLVGATRLDPRCERRPRGDQHLVTQIDEIVAGVAVTVERDQPGRDEQAEHVVERGRRLAAGELDAGLSPPRVRPALAEADQPQQDAVRDRACAGVMSPRQRSARATIATASPLRRPSPSASYSARVSSRRWRWPHSWTRVSCSSGRAPGSLGGVGEQPVDQARARSRPRARAPAARSPARSAAPRSGGKSTLARAVEPQRALHQLAVEVGAQREHDQAARLAAQRAERRGEPSLVGRASPARTAPRADRRRSRPAAPRRGARVHAATAARIRRGVGCELEALGRAGAAAHRPGRIVRTTSSPRRLRAASRGSTPAAISDDLPDPDGPTR